MGYTFKIGELRITTETYDEEDEDGNIYQETYDSYDVDSMTLPNAPEFINDPLSGQSNSRSPSYSAWSTFCKNTQLYDLFYDDRGNLIGGHPGYFPITQDVVDEIDMCTKACQRISTLPPGFEGMPSYDPIMDEHCTPDEGKYDPYLARILWLDFWVKWAFENCKNPAIVNW